MVLAFGGIILFLAAIVLVAAACLLLLASASGCVSVESTWRADGVANAAFDLQCSEEQLEMTRREAAGLESATPRMTSTTKFVVATPAATR